MSLAASHLDELMTLGRSKSFLGREFLTWLWYLSETMQERLRLEVDQQTYEVDLWVDDRLVLEGSAAMSHQNVMKGGDPSHSLEASASLATGKTVREMKLGIRVKDGGEYAAVIGCDDLSPRSLKLPAPEPQEGENGEAKTAILPLEDRLRAASTFVGILDALFARFRTIRGDAEWDRTVVKEMRDWIKRRQDKKNSDILH